MVCEGVPRLRRLNLAHVVISVDALGQFLSRLRRWESESY